jgi:hypothetical protein
MSKDGDAVLGSTLLWSTTSIDLVTRKFEIKTESRRLKFDRYARAWDAFSGL